MTKTLLTKTNSTLTMNRCPKQTAIILLTLFVLSCFVPLSSVAAETLEPANLSTTIPSNSQPLLIWNITLPWNFTDTPAQNLSNAEIIETRKSWINPVICDEIVYAGVTSSVYYGRHFGPAKNWINVYAIEAKTGRIIWDFQANLAFDTKTKIAVSDGKVFLTAKGIGYAEGFVIALNATNGSLLWKMPCAIFNSIPVTDNGNVFINSDHSLIGFDGINGRVIWNYTLRKFVNAPTTAKGILYAISTDNHLYAINTTDGSHLWDIYTYPGFSGIMVAEDVVYAPSNDGNIYALNSLTGAILWKHDTTPSEFNWANFTVHTTPVYNSGLLFFTSQSRQHIYIRNDFGGDAGHVYTRTSVYALEASTGNKVWNYTVA